MKVGLIGATGYVGSHFVAFFQERGINYCPITREQTSGDLVSLLRGLRVTTFINAAGYIGRNVDDCRLQQKRCIDDNLLLPDRLAAAARSLDMPWVHLSSGCIFEGFPHRIRTKCESIPDLTGWRETDNPNFDFSSPRHSFYTGCKSMAEGLISNSHCLILRLRLPFGSRAHPRNFLTKVLGYPILSNEINSMTCVEDLPLWTWKLLNRSKTGIYHCCNQGLSTPKEILQLLVKHRKWRTNTLPKFLEDPADLYRPLATEPRSNTVLSVDKLEETIGEVRSVVAALKSCCRKYRA